MTVWCVMYSGVVDGKKKKNIRIKTIKTKLSLEGLRVPLNGLNPAMSQPYRASFQHIFQHFLLPTYIYSHKRLS